MGLDTSHDCWHGTYSYFHEWRNAVAKAAGWPMTRATTGHRTGEEVYDLPKRDEYTDQTYLGLWRDDPADALEVLMAHSDCDGIIPWRFTEPIAARLRQIQPKLTDAWAFDAATQFILGLLKAHEAGEDVDFH